MRTEDLFPTTDLCYHVRMIWSEISRNLRSSYSSGLRIDGDGCIGAEGEGGGEERQREAAAELQVAGDGRAHNR